MPTPPNAVDPLKRRRVGRALALWSGVTLTGLAAVAALAIWHLLRRGQRVRDRLGPPREIDWPEPDGHPSEPVA